MASRLSSLSAWIIVIILFISPAASVTMLTDFPVVRMYLEKDRSPYTVNSSITITCFGYVCAGNDCRESTKQLVNTTGFIVFSDICPTYGCAFYRYGEVGGLHSGPYFSRCDLLVSSADRNYTLAGYADRPFTNCTTISPSMHRVLTPEYFACMGRESDKRAQCVQGNASSDLAWIQSCRDTYTSDIGSCRSNYTYPNPAVPEWRGKGLSPRPATEVCDMHLALPPDNPVISSPVAQSPGSPTGQGESVPAITYGVRATATAHSFDPLGNLYCSLLRFIGGRCG